jgi:ribosome-associated translation inhibitor RaiA
VKIQIREGEPGLAVAERSHVEERLTVTLARFSERIAKVVVRLSSTESTEGPSENRCRIEVELRPQTLHVEDRDERLLLALDRATDRVGRAVARALEGHLA